MRKKSVDEQNNEATYAKISPRNSKNLTTPKKNSSGIENLEDFDDEINPTP